MDPGVIITPKPRPTWLVPLLTGALSLLLGFFLGRNLPSKLPLATPTPTPTPIAVSTPTPDITANWKTYKNEKYGFSFKYPSDWEVQESKNEFKHWEQVIYISTKYKEGEVTGATMGTIHIWKQSVDGERRTLEDVLKELRELGEEVGEYTIDGHTVYKSEMTDQAPTSATDKKMYYESNGYLHQVSFVIADTPVKAQNIKQVDQILSTFKFLDQSVLTPTPKPTSLLPTTNWQTASNVRISLKYPSGLYNVQTGDGSIQLISKSNPNNRPDFLVQAYDGGSRRVWYNSYFSYYPNEVKFTEKQLGPVSALYALYSQPPSSNDNYLISSGKTIVLVLPQGADPKTLETIISTLKFFGTPASIVWKYFNENYSEQDRNFKFKYPTNFTVENVDSGSVELRSNGKTTMYVEEFSAFTQASGDSLDNKLSNWLSSSNLNRKLLSNSYGQVINSNGLVVYKFVVSGEAGCGGGVYDQAQWTCYLGALGGKGFTLADMNNFSEIATLLKSIEFK